MHLPSFFPLISFFAGEGPVLGNRIEIEALHKTKGIFPIEMAIVAGSTSEGRVFTAWLRDSKSFVVLPLLVVRLKDAKQHKYCTHTRTLNTLTHLFVHTTIRYTRQSPRRIQEQLNDAKEHTSPTHTRAQRTHSHTHFFLSYTYAPQSPRRVASRSS
jgi:hypothetical protein